jgi:hypothetical protein
VPGQHFTIVWNPALFEQQVFPSSAYPGDSYVDVIATDAYNTSYDYGYTVPTTRWNSVNNDSWGVAQIIAFAKTHNKPYAFPEWGTGMTSDGHGGGDDPMFMANMAPLVKNSLYSSYWDFTGGGYNAELSGSTAKLGAMAVFMMASGSSSAGSGSTDVAEKNTGAIVASKNAPVTAVTLPVTAVGGYATAVQNGPGHFEIIVWTAGDVAGTVKVTLGAKASNANLYDPTVGTAPVQALGAISSATVTVPAGHPMLLAVQQ